MTQEETEPNAKPDTETDRYIGSGFRKDLAHVINKHSMENGSDTPDYILAEYLTNCLRAFDNAVRDTKFKHYAERISKTSF